MREVWITDAAAVTPLGDSLNQLWQGLLAGQSSIGPVLRFPVDNYSAGIAACIEDLSPTADRSMTHSLLERLIMQVDRVPPDSLLITATTKSGIDNLERIRLGISADSRDVQLSRAAETISRRLGLIGESMNISASCASSTIAIAQGAAMIAAGRAEVVIICCMDLVTEFVFSGFSCLRALSPTPCRPFDRNRSGLTLGEGAASLLLMSAERAQREHRARLGTILGWGAVNDASHITAPAKNACGLIRAIHLALKMSARKSRDIAAICAHGTGTVYNDLMELKAFNQVFGNHNIPVYSVKGAIGHTLGAAGGIEVALSLQTLSNQVVPPTVGFDTPEKGAQGSVSSKPTEISGDCLLTTNSGFGGINAAIILKKGQLP
jgi:3-oxoacyl-[acyl-carrier-protein] synthase II